MKSSILLLVSSLAASVLAAPASTYSVHEKRNVHTTSKWAKRNEPLDRRSIVPVNIALTQRNIENGHDFLMDVSDPQSSNYGQHWTPEKVAETFAAEEATVTSVKSWLTSSGIAEERITVSVGRTFIRMNLTIAEAESLLKTEYNVFEHTETAKRSLAVDEYNIPEHVRRYIDYISPTVQPLTMTKHILQKEAQVTSLDIAGSGLPNWVWDLSSCDKNTTRACIQAQYNMPNGTYKHSPLAIVEYETEAYLKNDLDLYMHNFVSEDCEDEPTILVMKDTTFNTTKNPDVGEGNLDVQVGYGLTWPNPILYYQIGSVDVFFDAVDASFCNASEKATCGKTELAHVISTSWGSSEDGSAAQIRQCNEYLKLGLLGTTVVFSSGDSGVGSKNSTTFQVDAESACPYVTSVGATQLPAGSTYKDPEEAVTWFGSGGGFSNVWPLPDYQKSAMQNYYKNYAPSYNSSVYNNTQKVRGYPDISAAGSELVIYVNNTLSLIGGTSASCPIVASLVTLINEQRIQKNKKPVGFINPVLYANPTALNDVVKGSNPGAGTPGFSAVPGWDPVTGLGTPDYQKLLEVFMALP